MTGRDFYEEDEPVEKVLGDFEQAPEHGKTTAPHANPEHPLRFLIWSNEHRMWWRSARRGYTEWIEQAGRYGRTEAQEIVASATLDGQLNKVQTDPFTGESWVMASEVMVLAPEDIV